VVLRRSWVHGPGYKSDAVDLPGNARMAVYEHQQITGYQSPLFATVKRQHDHHNSPQS